MGSKKLNGDEGSIYGRDKYTFSAKEYANGGHLPEFQIKGEKVIKGVQRAYDWGKKLIQGRKIAKDLDNALKLSQYTPKGSITLPNTRQYIPSIPYQLGNTINYTDVLIQQQQDRAKWVTSLLNPKTQLNLPPSSSLLDYYPTHAVNKEIPPEKAWWNTPGFIGPWSEQVYYEVTLKDGSTRIMTPELIKMLPKTQEELQRVLNNEWKVPASEQSFLAGDIVNISSTLAAHPKAEVMNMNVERGFVPIPLNKSLEYPKDVTIGKDIQFPYSITDKYINQKWLKENDPLSLGSRGSLALNFPPGIDPKTMSNAIWDQFVAEGGLKPRFTSYKEEALKKFFARDPITGELKPIERHRGMHRKEDGITPGGEYYKDPLEFIKKYDENNTLQHVGKVDATGDVNRLFSMMEETGYPIITGKQYNEIFPNLYHGSPHKFKSPKVENLDKYKTGDKKEKFGNYPGFYITHNPAVASTYMRWGTGKHSKIDYGHGQAPLSEVPDASLYKIKLNDDAKIFFGGDIRKVSIEERKKLIDQGYDAVTGWAGENENMREILILNKDAIKTFKDIPRDTPEYKWMWDENLNTHITSPDLKYGIEDWRLKFHYDATKNPYIKLDELGNPSYDQSHLRLWEEGGELPEYQIKGEKVVKGIKKVYDYGKNLFKGLQIGKTKGLQINSAGAVRSIDRSPNFLTNVRNFGWKEVDGSHLYDETIKLPELNLSDESLLNNSKEWRRLYDLQNMSMFNKNPNLLNAYKRQFEPGNKISLYRYTDDIGRQDAFKYDPSGGQKYGSYWGIGPSNPVSYSKNIMYRNNPGHVYRVDVPQADLKSLYWENFSPILNRGAATSDKEFILTPAQMEKYGMTSQPLDLHIDEMLKLKKYGGQLPKFQDVGELPKHLDEVDLTKINEENSKKINSPAYRERIRKEYLNAHNKELSETELDQMVADLNNQLLQGANEGNTGFYSQNVPDANAAGFMMSGTGQIDADGNHVTPRTDGYDWNNPTKGNIYLARNISQEDPFTNSGTSMEESVKQHEVNHRLNSLSGTPFSSSRQSPLYDESYAYHNSFFGNAPEGNPFNPSFEDKSFSDYARQPFEIKSQKSQLEQALRDANIWDESEGEFTEEHVIKLMNSDIKFNKGFDYLSEGLGINDLLDNTIKEPGDIINPMDSYTEYTHDKLDNFLGTDEKVNLDYFGNDIRRNDPTAYRAIKRRNPWGEDHGTKKWEEWEDQKIILSANNTETYGTHRHMKDLIKNIENGNDPDPSQSLENLLRDTHGIVLQQHKDGYYEYSKEDEEKIKGLLNHYKELHDETDRLEEEWDENEPNKKGWFPPITNYKNRKDKKQAIKDYNRVYGTDYKTWKEMSWERGKGKETIESLKDDNITKLVTDQNPGYDHLIGQFDWQIEKLQNFKRYFGGNKNIKDWKDQGNQNTYERSHPAYKQHFNMDIANAYLSNNEGSNAYNSTYSPANQFSNSWGDDKEGQKQDRIDHETAINNGLWRNDLYTQAIMNLPVTQRNAFMTYYGDERKKSDDKFKTKEEIDNELEQFKIMRGALPNLKNWYEKARTQNRDFIDKSNRDHEYNQEQQLIKDTKSNKDLKEKIVPNLTKFMNEVAMEEEGMPLGMSKYGGSLYKRDRYSKKASAYLHG